MQDWGGNTRTTYVSIGASNHSEGERQQHDYYATDPIAIDSLLGAIHVRRNVWECACGQMHLANRLKELGHDVYASDLVVRPNDCKIECHQLDFLKTTRRDVPFEGYCDIITNPPFKYAMEFVLHALDLICDRQVVCMFLKVQFLEGKKRRIELFDKFPPRQVLVFSERINCFKNGDVSTFDHNGAMAYAWYVWEKGWQGKTTIEWL